MNDDSNSINSGSVTRNLINYSKNKEHNSMNSKSNKKQNLDNELESTIEEQISILKNTLTPNEFLNSIKSGFELALCNCYFLNHLKNSKWTFM